MCSMPFNSLFANRRVYKCADRQTWETKLGKSLVHRSDLVFGLKVTVERLISQGSFYHGFSQNVINFAPIRKGKLSSWSSPISWMAGNPDNSCIIADQHTFADQQSASDLKNLSLDISFDFLITCLHRKIQTIQTRHLHDFNRLTKHLSTVFDWEICQEELCQKCPAFNVLWEKDQVWAPFHKGLRLKPYIGGLELISINLSKSAAFSLQTSENSFKPPQNQYKRQIQVHQYMATRGSCVHVHVHKPIVKFSVASRKCQFYAISPNTEWFQKTIHIQCIALIKLYKCNQLEKFFIFPT